MIKYQYQIVRYIHDLVTSEFINVGIVVYNSDVKFLKSKFISKYSRVTQFFPEANGHYLISSLKQFDKNINKISKEQNELFFDFNSLEEITSSFLPKDDSALICSEVFTALDVNLDSAIDYLYNNLIDKYTHKSNKTSLNDNQVWNNIYKDYFDKYSVTENLKPHKVTTLNDELEFEKSWKNGSWHCYQPISFDLKKEDAIKNKVYKWSGILTEIEKSNEHINIYFLAVNSKKHKDLGEFITDTLTRRANKKVLAKIVMQDEAENFAKQISSDMTEHID